MEIWTFGKNIWVAEMSTLQQAGLFQRSRPGHATVTLPDGQVTRLQDWKPDFIDEEVVAFIGKFDGQEYHILND